MWIKARSVWGSYLFVQGESCCRMEGMKPVDGLGFV